MPFCLHLNMLIFNLFFFNSRWFCFPSSACSFSPGFLQKISNLIFSEHWFLSRGGKSSFPLSWAGCLVSPLHPKTASPGSSSQSRGVQWNKCMIHTLSQSSQKNAYRENSHLIITRTGLILQGLFCSCVVWGRVHQTQRTEQFLNSSLLSKTQSSGLCCWSTLG